MLRGSEVAAPFVHISRTRSDGQVRTWRTVGRIPRRPDRQAQAAFFDLVTDQYEFGFWWEGGYPAPSAPPRSRARTCRIVLRF